MFLSRMFAAVLFGVSLASLAQADDYADAVIENLTAMKSVYQSTYAPADWKRNFAGYDLQKSYEDAVEAVRSKETLSQPEVRTILKNFIYAMKDYHVSISFLSTEMATLPFTVKGAGDRYFIVHIDRTKLPESSFPFSVGDELVSMGGKATAEVVAEVQAEVTENVPATDKALAELRLTSRAASRGYTVPRGPVMLGIRPQGSEEVVFQQLIWDYTPEVIAPRTQLGGQKSFLGEPSLLKSPQMTVDVGLSAEELNENPYALGTKKTFMPGLGTKVWESADDSVFHAYIYKTADRHLIGYIRIASYVQPDYVKAVKEFSDVMGRFEEVTDALVIDQVNNPGGSVFYLYALASMLTDKPLFAPLHRMAVSQSEVLEAKQALDDLKELKNDEDVQKHITLADLSGFPPSYEFVKFYRSYAQFMIDEWNAGRKLTTPYWIAGVNFINPAPVHYTKPILVLTNPLDFSGGDFFPTILQDNKRATIMGTRTAGAGGYVNNVSMPNNIGVGAFRITQSIAARIDGNPIENLGVIPDVQYEMTVQDMTQNYKPYVEAVNAAVTKLLEN